MVGLINESNFPAGGRKIILAGNPNVGKSVFFNALTGSYVDVSNYPGTTMKMICGRFGEDVIIDTPGVYGLSSFNEEERMVMDIVAVADVVINVVDAVHLARDLFLTLQLLDTGVPLLIALNMVDEAAREGVRVNASLLEEMLDVPVVATTAVNRGALEELRLRLSEARPGQASAGLRHKPVDTVRYEPGAGEEEALPSQARRLENIRRRSRTGHDDESVYRARRELADQIARQVMEETADTQSFAARLAGWMIMPVTGLPLLALTLYLTYQAVGVFVAQTLVEFTEEVMFAYYEPAVQGFLANYIQEKTVFSEILVGQYGLLTFTFTYLLGLLLPLVLGIFLVLSVLEDSGYLPRIAILLDRSLSCLGLNGQAIIPLILGFGCVTMACITTRLLGSKRERRIVLFLLSFGIPCSAMLAIAMAVFAVLDTTFMLLYVFTLLAILVIAGTILGRLLPGRPAPLLMELPSLRLPKPHNFLKKAGFRAWHFVKEAFPLFAGGALLLSILDLTGLLMLLRDLLVPVTVVWLRLPAEIADVFIMGFIRKEFGAASILGLQMLPLQNFVAILTLTLTVPCIASTLMIFKELGWREGVLIWVGVCLLAFFTGGVMARLWEYFVGPGSAHNPLTLIIIALAVLAIAALARMNSGKTA